MGWKKSHARWVAQLPEDVREAHRRSANHRGEIEASTVCGCFYCLSTYPPEEIRGWTHRGQTAKCPRCGIDSVVGDKSGLPITTEFLSKVKSHWFAPTSDGTVGGEDDDGGRSLVADAASDGGGGSKEGQDGGARRWLGCVEFVFVMAVADVTCMVCRRSGCSAVGGGLAGLGVLGLLTLLGAVALRRYRRYHGQR